MSTTHFVKTVSVAGTFDATVQAVKSALGEQGFGILTEIDVRATLKKKLGIDHPPTLILGACNPKLAHRALTAEPDVSTLMPCNVVVRETPSGTVEVVALDPLALKTLIDHPEIEAVAHEGGARLDQALAALTTT
ncbi:MAG: DUF302 domain-containing protein [Magnetococcales bacterium]|nr:DUF302 domain-containing protein [Magnetococcales bacterium]